MLLYAYETLSRLWACYKAKWSNFIPLYKWIGGSQHDEILTKHWTVIDVTSSRSASCSDINGDWLLD